MAEDFAYENIGGNDPDPLGIRKKLGAKPDPLGLRKKLTVVPAVDKTPAIPTIDFSKPLFTTMEPLQRSASPPKEVIGIEAPDYSGGADAYSEEARSPTITYPRERELATRAQKAQKELLRVLQSYPDVEELMIRNQKRQMAERAIGLPTSDMPKTSAQLTAERIIEREPSKADLPVSDEEKAQERELNLTNEAKARALVEGVAKRYPKEASSLKKMMYDIDIANSLANDPNARQRLEKAAHNSSLIGKGKLDYDVTQGILWKPEGPIASFMTGWKNKTKAFKDTEFLRNTENNAAIADQLDYERTAIDPDEPVPVARGVINNISGMLGATPAKALAGGAIGTALGGPKAGIVSSAIIGGRETAKLEYSTVFKEVYYELRDKGVSKDEAVETARSQAEQAAEVGAVVGGVSGLVGAKWGVRPLPQVALSSSMRQAAASVLRKEGADFSKTLAEGLAAGSVAAAGERYKNSLAQAAGLDRDIDRGMMEQIEANLIFATALSVATKGGKATREYRTLLNGLKRAKEEHINTTLNQWVEEGQITEQEAATAKQEIANYKEVDGKIPEKVSEDARIKIQDKIKRRDELEKRLETQDKAFHPEIKEKIKLVEEEINELGKQRAPLPDKEITALKKLIDQEIEDGNVGYPKDILKETDPSDLPALMKEIADQANDPDSAVQTLETFGEAIVNKAKEMYPIQMTEALETPAKSAGISVVRPEQRMQPTETITIKPKQDAIPVEITNEMDVRQQTGDGGAMGKGDAESEIITGEKIIGEEGATTSKEKVDVPEMTGITHSKMDEMSRRLGFPEYEKGPETFKQWNEEAAKKIKEDPNAISDLVNKLRKGEMPSAMEQRMMAIYVADLDAKLMKDPKNKDILNELNRAKDLSNIVGGRMMGQSMVARKELLPLEETLGDYYERQQEATKASILTDQQMDTNIKEFNEISSVKKALEEKVGKLEAENIRLKAEQKVKETKSSRDAKRTHADYVKERKDIKASIGEKLRKARGETSVVAIPYAKELIAIAPDVAKMVKSYVEEGIDNLPAIVDAIHKELKELIEPITKEDVRAIIAGEYNEKKPSRNDLTSKLRDLKDEARLIGKLQELEAGTEPKSERLRIKRNQQIEELKKKVQADDLTKLAASKARMKSEISKIETQLQKGEYSKPEKTEIKLDEEGVKLKNKLIQLRKDREIRLAQDELAARSALEKTGDILMIPIRELRTIWSSFDFSMPMRQGLIPTAAELLTNPKATGIRAKNMVRAAASEQFFDGYMDELRSSPHYGLMEKSGLAITDPNNFSKKEEVFQSRYVEKIPIVGTYGIKGSERAAAYWLNNQRSALFLQGVQLMQENGRTFDNSPEAYKNWASIVNTMTGRGELVGQAKNAAGFLSAVFFSPKLMASRLAFFNPFFYNKIPKELRWKMAWDMGKFIAFGNALLGLGQMFGAETEYDPRSADFGKIKAGDTRWDIWGGFQQYIRLFASIPFGKKTASGEIVSLLKKGKSGERPAVQTLLTFLRSKSSPIVSTGWDILAGENIVGEDVTLKTELSKMLPIMARDMREAAQREGMTGILKESPALIGIGTQTYNRDSKKTPSKTRQRPKTEKRKAKRESKND